MTWNCTDLKATKSRFRMVETKSADNFLVPYRVLRKGAKIVLFDWMWALGYCIQALRVNVTSPQNCLKVTQKLQERSVSIPTLNILRILMLSNFILFAEFCILWTTFSVPWYISLPQYKAFAFWLCLCRLQDKYSVPQTDWATANQTFTIINFEV